MDCEQEMAQRCFGYGRWGAPFWFIGPEQGMTDDVDELAFRCEAWRNCGSQELNDCIAFHRELEKLRRPKLNKYGKRIDDWHGENANTQRTWSRLIQFLIGYGASAVTKHLEYQKHHWGTRNGQTCVAELSGVPAHNFATKRERERFLPARLLRLGGFLTGDQQFVLLYGKTEACKVAWEELTRNTVPVGHCSRGEVFRRKGNTVFVHSPFHPTGNGQSYEIWQRFGREVKILHQAA